MSRKPSLFLGAEFNILIIVCSFYVPQRLTRVAYQRQGQHVAKIVNKLNGPLKENVQQVRIDSGSWYWCLCLTTQAQKKRHCRETKAHSDLFGNLRGVFENPVRRGWLVRMLECKAKDKQPKIISVINAFKHCDLQSIQAKLTNTIKSVSVKI